MLKGREVRLYPARPKYELKCVTPLRVVPRSFKVQRIDIVKYVSLTKVV